ncbi:MAG: SDR family oxidoreductase [Ruminococcaceae bacterium]|nr:SDR family oxidoreductase [Oscillospiraceae bacterium]
MELGLKGKTCLITGGTTGLGAATAELLAAEGVSLALNYVVKEEESIAFAKHIADTYGVKCFAVYADISKPEDDEAMVNKTIAELGQIDILVNCAGIWPTAYVEEMTDAQWEKCVAIDLNGTFFVTQRVVKHMIAKGIKGRIITTVSQAAFHGSTSGHAHYAASKGGLVTFNVSLAREVAKYGINCTCVAPGMMRTQMNEKALAEREDQYLERIPLGRISTAKDVANVITFLASEPASYITGATIDVTGGMLMR